MTFEKLTKKHILLIGRDNYSNPAKIWSNDNTQSTTDIKEAAKWLHCREKSIAFVDSGWNSHTCFYFEEDPNVPNAVKLHFLNARNFNASANAGKRIEYIGYIYVYSNGKVSHSVGCNEDFPERPRRVRTANLYPLESQNNSSYSWGAYDWGACVLNSKPEIMKEPLSTIENYTHSLGKEVIAMLQRQGFNLNITNKYGGQILLSKDSNMREFLNWIQEYPVENASEKTKEYQNLEKEGVFSPLDSKTYTKVERTKEGVLFRMKSGYSYEHNRILFTNKGTCSRQVYKDSNWIRDNKKDTSEFYDSLRDGHIEGEITDLFSENEKFKYLNSWINEHKDALFHLGDYSSYGTEGIIEFLRLYNAYPVLIDTLIKLGYFDALALKEEIDLRYHNGRYETVHTGKFWFNTEKFMSRFGFSSWYNRQSEVVLKRGCKDFTETLGINKYQWRRIIKLINEVSDDDPEKKNKWIYEVFGLIPFSNLFFTKKCSYSRSHLQEGLGYSSLKDVPDNEFEDYLEMCDILERDKKTNPERFKDSLDLYNSDLSDCSKFSLPKRHFKEREYKFGSDGEAFSVKHVKQYIPFKLYKKLYSSEANLRNYTDYLSMRQSCMRFAAEGLFHPEDWPLSPKAEYISRFHDRLVELYNEFTLLAQEREASAKQQKWEARIDKEKLLKFEYEEEEDERCIIIPKKIIELLSEGQKLHHCVGSYTDSVAEGRETIIFLRKKAERDVPYATLDIAYDKTLKKWKMRQAHTAYNGNITKEDVDFLRRWAKKHNIDPETIHESSGALCHL